jgi:hypothetical protein
LICESKDEMRAGRAHRAVIRRLMSPATAKGNAMQTSTLRPGLLVSLSTTITGNCVYKRRDLIVDHTTNEGTREASWQTDRTIFDAAEDQRAREVRSKARSLITGVCARFGEGTLLCPLTKRNDLDAAISEAKRLAVAFNETATLSRISVTVFTGEVAADDVQAVKDINAEISKLMATMANGIDTLNVEQVREAANKARNLSGMLTEQAQERVQVAIRAAREAARKIVNAGEQAAQEIDTQAIRKVMEQRTAFLDVDEAPAETAAPSVEQRGLDLDEIPPAQTAAPVAPVNAPPVNAMFDL